MEPIESLGREAKALVEKAEKEAEASLADAERDEAEADGEPDRTAENVQKV
jgi:hypothetical protein